MDYFFSRNFGGYIYTIDMIRLKTYVLKHDAQNIRKYLTSQNLKFWCSNSFGKFSENWSVDSLWFGLGSKTINSSDSHIIFCLEMNPNKASDRDWLLFYYFLMSYNFSLSRFDLAIDIPKNINNILFLNLHKRANSIFFNSFNNKTFYFGKGDGHTKIYNKKIESSLDYELTRYEVTKECDIDLHNVVFPYLNFNFLDIAFCPYYSSSGDSTLDAILYAVNNGFPYKSLSRRYKDIIKKDFVGSYELSNDFANSVLKDFLLFLISGLSNKPEKL